MYSRLDRAFLFARRRAFICLMVVLAMAPITHAAPPELNRTAAVMRFAILIEAALPNATVSVDGEAVRVVMAGGEPSGFATLGPTLDDMALMSTELERDTRLSIVAAGLVASLSKPSGPTDWASAQRTLVPVVRSDLSFLADEGMVAAEKSVAASVRFPRIPWVGELAIGFALDRPDAVLRVEQRTFEPWKKSERDLLPLAVANLRKLVPKPFAKHADGFFVASNGDTLDAGRVLLVDDIRALRMKSAPLAILPTRDLLVLVPEGDPTLVSKALAFADANQAGGRVIHAPVLKLTDSGWERYSPKGTSATDAAIQRYNLLAKLRLHAEQKEHLDPLSEDVFVASLSAYEISGRVVETVVLNAELTTLLPRADIVGLVRHYDDGSEPKIIGYVDFTKLIEVAGTKAKPLGMSPERWRVEMALTPAELEALAPRESPL
jgi:hypothetical protein